MGIIQTARSPILRPAYSATASFVPDFIYRFDGTNGSAIANSEQSIPDYSGATILSRYISGNDSGGKFDNTVTYGGRSTCGKFRILQGSDGNSDGSTYGDMGFYVTPPTSLRATEGDILHIRIRVWVPSSSWSYSTGVGNLKWLRWTIGDQIDPNLATPLGRLDDWVIHGNAFGGATPDADQAGWLIGSELSGGSPTQEFLTNKIMPRGAWCTFESRIKFTTTASAAERRLWTNGEFAFERVNAALKWKDASGTQQTGTGAAAKTLVNITDYCNNLLFITYWNGGSGLNGGAYPAQNQFCYVDEIIIHKNTATLPQADEYGNPMIGTAEAA